MHIFRTLERKVTRRIRTNLNITLSYLIEKREEKIKINLNILDLRFKTSFSVLRIKDYNSFSATCPFFSNKKN